MSGKVGMRDRKDRNKRLTQLSEKKRQTFALRQLNQSKQVLLESSNEGILTGMTENYLKVHISSSSEALLNSIVAVELTGLQNSKILASIST